MTTTTTTDRDRAIELSSQVAEIREQLRELQDRFEMVMRDVRRLPGGALVHARVDAYPGTRLDRDMGLGQDADAWLAEVAGFLEGAADERCDGFRGEQAWGRCAGCGRLLADHDD